MAAASSAVEAQCVVQVRPSSTPARASRKEPEQTEVTRRERRAALRIQRIRPASFSAFATPKPPATTSVSMGRGSARWSSSEQRIGTRANGDRLGLLGHHLDGVFAAVRQSIGPREDLCRPDHVERLNSREGEDDDAARLGRGHRRIMALSVSVCNDQ